MKKLLLFLLCIAMVSTSVAQSEYRQAADIAFANLDRSGVTSGILYDRVFPVADLRQANAPSSSSHFQQAQTELY